MKRSKIFSLAVVLVLASSLLCFAGGQKESQKAATGQKATTGDEVYVDEWVFPSGNIITGVSAYHGMLNQFGAELALEKINKAGGIRGKPVRIRWFDEGTQDSARAVAAMSAMLDMKPLLVMGPCSDVSVRAAVPMAVEEGVYSMCTMAGYPMAREFAPWTLTFVNDDQAQARAGVNKWLELQPGMKKIVHFTAPESGTWMNIAKAENKACQDKGITTVDIEVPYDAVNYGPIAVRALGENPDGMIFTSHPEGIAKIIVELHKRGWTNNARLLLSQAAPVPALWEIGKGYLDGAYVWLWFDPNSDAPRWQELSKRHQQSFGAPASFMMVWKGYDELFLIKKTFEDLKITGDPARLKAERIAIRDYMNNCKGFEGIFGTVDFVNGVRQTPTLLFKIENNQLGSKVVAPVE
jgi:branched-chain amino acid transport system substrate-binding protein